MGIFILSTRLQPSETPKIRCLENRAKRNRKQKQCMQHMIIPVR